jgi:hypothetical protein
MVGVGVCRWGFGVGVAAATLAFVGLAQAEVPISENANQRFEEGVRYLSTQDADRYEKAYREFKAAYADSPSWKILGNLGIVAQELERDGEAMDAFKGYLEGGGKELSAQERAQFKKDLALLESGYITLDIQSKPNGAWIVDERLPEVGRSVVNRYGPTSGPLKLRVRAGHHLVRAELAGYNSDSWEFSEEPGGSVAHRMALRRTETASEAPVRQDSRQADLTNSRAGSPGLRTASYVAFGLGAVGVAAGTWFYFDGKDKSKQADAALTRCQQANGGECPEDPNNAQYRATAGLQDAEGAALTRSLISFVSGGALLTTGVVLFVMGSSESDAKEREQARITPWIGPGSVGLSGSF